MKPGRYRLALADDALARVRPLFRPNTLIALVALIAVCVVVRNALDSLAKLDTAFIAGRLAVIEYVQARNNTIQQLVGVILVVTLWLTWRQYQLSKSGQITDRFARAVELLGAVREGGDGRTEPNLEARLGAIYLLERIARDSVEDHGQVMEVLTAYVRENAKARIDRQAGEPFWIERVLPSSSATTPEARAIADVIRRRRSRRPEEPLNLSKTCLAWARLLRADLHSANFLWADLTDANLFKANLRDACLMAGCLHAAILNEADLTGADMSEADLTRAALRDANLTDANLFGANLRGAFVGGATFSGANMTQTDLSGVIGMTEEQLRSTSGTPVAVPKGFRPPVPEK